MTKVKLTKAMKAAAKRGEILVVRREPAWGIIEGRKRRY